MSRSTKSPLHYLNGLNRVTSLVTLALWRWRQHWFLLLVTGIGIVTAVTIVCTVPLLTVAMQTAGLRSVLTASPSSSEITLRATAVGLSTQTLEMVNPFATTPLQQQLKGYLKDPPRLEIQTPEFNIIPSVYPTQNTPLQLYGNSIGEAAPHLMLIQGRLPRTVSKDIEIALTPATANALHVRVGSVITIESTFYTVPVLANVPVTSQQSYIQRIKLYVVGLFKVKAHDSFWHNEDFLPEFIGTGWHFSALVSGQTLLAALDRIAGQYDTGGVYFPLESYAYSYWYYYLDPSRVSIDRLDHLIGQLAAGQETIARTNGDIQGTYQSALQQLDLYGPVLRNGIISSSLERFRDRIAVAKIPLAILVLEITCLVLLFVSLMVGLLVDRQTDTIALLRSRGASDSQILGSHITQCIGLSLLALVAGPLLAYALVKFIVQRLVSATNQDALNILSNAPAVLLNVRWYALITVGVMAVGMTFALYRASGMHVLLRRRGTSRQGWRPLWQRFNLDLVAAIIALTGYSIAVYLTDISGLLDARTQALVSTPVALIAPVFLLLAAMLLFLRLIPLFLRIGSRFVARGRSAAPMLALAQLARSPGQAMRMILLLALTIAFAIFTLVFASSQAQRAMDISTYQAGADFSGYTPLPTQLHSIKVETKLYRSIAGVNSATVGYVGEETAGALNALLPLQVRAVDPTTFAQATIWSSQNSSQPLAQLLAQLVARRNAAIHQGIVPAIVDAYAWSRLGLHVGEVFFVHLNSTVSDNVHYVAIAEVQHIPTLSSSPSGVDVGAGLLSGNVIVDYQTFAVIQKKYFGSNTPANYVWLRTSDDPAAVARVRSILQTSNIHLDELNDRRALLDAMRTDPLYLNLIIILALGTGAALLLALIGNLLASWVSIRTRLTQFVVLRALGATPRQVAGVLAWEQALVYLIALFIGAAFGVLLSITVVPALAFSSVPAASILGGLSSDAFYIIQHAIPTQVVFPLSLAIAFAVLVVICAVAVVMIVRITLQPSMSPLLRLSEERPPAPYVREKAVVTHTVPVQARSRPGGRSFVTLALWQLRRTWSLLLITGMGIIAAIMIVCSIPLLSAVMTTAGLRNDLNASPDSAKITLDASTMGLSTRVVQSVQQQLDPYFQAHIGTYLNQSAPLSIQSSSFTYISPSPLRKIYQLNLFAAPMEQAASHLTLLQGRLPHTTSAVIETLLTASTAYSLHVRVGSIMQLHFAYASQPQAIYGRLAPLGTLNLRVAGLFKVISAGDYLWHGNTFQPISDGPLSSYTLLIPTGAFLVALDQIAKASHAGAVFLPNSYELLWDYRLETSRIAYSQLADLTAQLTALQEDIQNKYGSTQSVSRATSSSGYPYLLQASVYNPVFGSFVILNILELYLNRVDVFRIPAAILVLQIIGLILLFISLMADILVDHQADDIAVLRSRGASSSQVAVFLIIQGIGLGIIALIVGPPLATIAVSIISLRFLDPKAQGAINIITNHPAQAILDVGWYAVATVLIIVIALSLLFRRAANLNLLSLRREVARSRRSALWHHLRLDGGAVVIALTAYGLSVYLNNLGEQLDIGTKTLFSAPLTIVASIFLIIGIFILFLRLFPFLLRLGAWFTARRRGAAPMLALAQLARSPRYATRMTLLLAFAIAFAIFSLVFSASQVQRIADISSFEAGADFSGDIAHDTDHLSLQEETTQYSTIPGVTSATVGYTVEGFALGTSPSVPVQIRTVDTDTFGRTAIWTSQDSSQPLASLLAQLVARRNQAIKARVVPAIVDAASVNELSLAVGAPFTINISSLPYNILNCVVVAEVQHIPTVNSGAGAGNAGDASSPGGILIDYATYAAVYRGNIQDNHLKANPILPFNHVWLRTINDPAAVAHMRAALETKDLLLDNLYDRQMLSNALRSDPLFLNLMAFFTLGAITALLLALLADLLACWLSVRTRLTNFAVLRAQGATPQQTANVLTWEQGIVHATALLLGGAFGAVLSVTTVPALIFTNIPVGGVLSNVSNSEFYIIQQVVPPQIVVPASLGIVFLMLLVIFVVALVTMVWVALRPSLGQALRLNED